MDFNREADFSKCGACGRENDRDPTSPFCEECGKRLARSLMEKMGITFEKEESTDER